MRLVLLVALLPALAAAGPLPPTTRLIQGPLPAMPTAAPSAPDPAPIPNRDVNAPLPLLDRNPRLEPGMADRGGLLSQGNGYAPGSGYSSLLERHGRTAGGLGTGLGTTLVPSLTIRLPLTLNPAPAPPSR